ncbi:hypothetical protein GCM10025768_28280 [Microbacterium pseudoresistens]
MGPTLPLCLAFLNPLYNLYPIRYLLFIMFYSPLDQFEIKPLLMVNNILTLALTNYTLYLIIVVSIIFGYTSIISNGRLGSTR